jgi:hypothetical protein
VQQETDRLGLGVNILVNNCASSIRHSSGWSVATPESRPKDSQADQERHHAGPLSAAPWPW